MVHDSCPVTTVISQLNSYNSVMFQALLMGSSCSGLTGSEADNQGLILDRGQSFVAVAR
jgi:hypothetical protein